MAQLVFVHGVATRSGSAADAAEANMRQLFEATVFHDVPLQIYMPRWGDLVPKVPAGVYATDGDFESFSVGGDAEDYGVGTGETTPAAGMSVGEVAASRPQLALDVVLARLVDDADRQSRRLTEEELVVFESAVGAIDSHDAALALTAGGASDGALIAALEPEAESLSVSISSIRKAVTGVTDRIRNLASSLAYGLVRDSVRPAVGLFSGDVFAYLNDGDLRRDIRSTVGAAIGAAWTARVANEPMVLVGHSMGGVILADMLADPIAAGLPQGLAIDCLFTVGSQVGLFQSVGALVGGAPDAGTTMSRPDCVRNWFNVFDPIDPLAFAAEPVFSDVWDLEFDSITGMASAHTTYFKRPQFYARFGKRLADLNLIR